MAHSLPRIRDNTITCGSTSLALLRAEASLRAMLLFLAPWPSLSIQPRGKDDPAQVASSPPVASGSLQGSANPLYSACDIGLALRMVGIGSHLNTSCLQTRPF